MRGTNLIEIYDVGLGHYHGFILFWVGVMRDTVYACQVETTLSIN
jgi:hypothetical protein